MDLNPHETVEQQAIELMSSLGKEHLFVANCPSDIDPNRYSGTVITYEEAFDHSDTGVGLCLLLPKAYVLQKFVDICLNKDISVHFVFTCPSNTSEFEASAWLYNLLHDKVQHIGFMQNLGITCCANNSQENISSHAKLSRMPSIVKSLGLNLAERLSMSFPGPLLNGTILSVSYRICLRLTTLTFDDPMDVTAYQIRLTSPHLLYKLPMTAWQTSNSWRRSYNQLLMLLGRMVLLSVK